MLMRGVHVVTRFRRLPGATVHTTLGYMVMGHRWRSLISFGRQGHQCLLLRDVPSPFDNLVTSSLLRIPSYTNSNHLTHPLRVLTPITHMRPHIRIYLHLDTPLQFSRRPSGLVTLMVFRVLLELFEHGIFITVKIVLVIVTDNLPRVESFLT